MNIHECIQPTSAIVYRYNTVSRSKLYLLKLFFRFSTAKFARSSTDVINSNLNNQRMVFFLTHKWSVLVFQFPHTHQRTSRVSTTCIKAGNYRPSLLSVCSFFLQLFVAYQCIYKTYEHIQSRHVTQWSSVCTTFVTRLLRCDGFDRLAQWFLPRGNSPLGGI